MLNVKCIIIDILICEKHTYSHNKHVKPSYFYLQACKPGLELYKTNKQKSLSQDQSDFEESRNLALLGVLGQSVEKTRV